MCLIISSIVIYFEILSLSVSVCMCSYVCVCVHMCACGVRVYVSNRQPDSRQLCFNLCSASGLTDENSRASWTFLGKHASLHTYGRPTYSLAALRTYGYPSHIWHPYIHMAALHTYGCATYIWPPTPRNMLDMVFPGLPLRAFDICQWPHIALILNNLWLFWSNSHGGGCLYQASSQVRFRQFSEWGLPSNYHTSQVMTTGNWTFKALQTHPNSCRVWQAAGPHSG